MMFALSQAASWLGVASAPEWSTIIVKRVVTDSRAIQAGDLFIALVGDRFDGHDFVAQALRDGAVAAVVAHPVADCTGPLLQVDDTLLALGQLGRSWREQFSCPVVAITGSNGKTSVKEMVAAILRAACADDAAVLATHGNLNNEIGVPLTLLSLRPHHRFAVIEMGMNHRGEIARLTQLAQPSVALVNNAMRAHLGHFSDVSEIAEAKGEIFQGLQADGVAVIPLDDPHAARWQQLAAGCQQLTFGIEGGQVYASSVSLADEGSRAEFHLASESVLVQLPLPGEHMLRNALAAAAIAHALSIPAAAIVTGLAQLQPVKGRLYRHRLPDQRVVIDDSYNANPDSVRAAIRVLAAGPEPRCLIFGDIGELGAFSAAAHREIGDYAAEQGIDYVLTLGESSALASAAFGDGGWHFGQDIEALLRAYHALLPLPHTTLVKGSRFMAMERVVQRLLANK